MRRLLAFWVLFAGVVDVQAQTPLRLTAVNQTVRAGETTRVYTWFTCAKADAPFVPAIADVGSIERRTLKQRRCGYTNYPVAVYWYTPPAGFRGFATITFTMPYSDPVRRRVRVVDASPSASIEASQAQRSAKKASGPLSGQYVNQLGNVINVRRDILYFTGTWRGENVSQKPFAVVEQTPTTLRWANYSCSGSTQAFQCLNSRNGELRLYRRLDR